MAGAKFAQQEGPAALSTNVHILAQTPQLLSMMTMLRDSSTSRADFVFYANRIIRLVVEEGLNKLPIGSKSVITPTGCTYGGSHFQGRICGVSIMRAGEAMEQGLRECCRSVRIGKILIQRDESTALPKLYYSKLPPDVQTRYCLLLDPMLATGGTAGRAIEVLLEHGVAEERIVFLCLIASREGISSLLLRHPSLHIVTAAIDTGLNGTKHIVPGLGDFGCRYFGTDK